MRVVVDSGLCIGCGLCEQECPDVFRLGEDGVAYVLTDSPPLETYEDVRACAEICPVSAIAVAAE